MIHRAYSDHIPITLRPDDFWFYIAYGFSRHININSEKYRKRLVGFEGKKELIVIKNEFVKGSKNNDWDSVFPEFSDKIGNYVGKTKDLVVAEFSTSTRIDVLSYEITLMDAMKQYFDYKVLTKCGIPEINLLGTKADWQDLKARINIFKEFDLGWWIDFLDPVLDNIIKVYDGVVDKSFWNSIYKHEDHGSGGPHITGWINYLFPYIQKYDNTIINSIVMSKYDDYSCKSLSTSNYLSSIVSVPFVWDYFGNEMDLKFTTGHLGYSQHEDGSLYSVMGWGVLYDIENSKLKKLEEIYGVERPEKQNMIKKYGLERDVVEVLPDEPPKKLKIGWKAEQSEDFGFEKGLIKRRAIK